MSTRADLTKAMTHAINANSAENGCNTPDFILGDFLTDVLDALDRAVNTREKWYGRAPKAAGGSLDAPCASAPAPVSPDLKLALLRQHGILNKYTVTKTDGSPVDKDAVYFCLRLDDGGGDPVHVAACRAAALTYADNIRHHLPLLAQDIYDRYGMHRRDPHTEQTDYDAVVSFTGMGKLHGNDGPAPSISAMVNALRLEIKAKIANSAEDDLADSDIESLIATLLQRCAVRKAGT